MLIALLGLILAITGTGRVGELALPLAALYHFVGDVFVIGNSFRLFRFGEEFAHAEANNEPKGIKRRAGSVRGLSAQTA
jgi:hypothetical protein